jgi:hypothetical protein
LKCSDALLPLVSCYENENINKEDTARMKVLLYYHFLFLS